MNDEIENYILLSSSSASDLSNQVTEALTKGIHHEREYWLWTTGWELYSPPTCSSSMGKNPRGYLVESSVYCQALVIKKGNTKIVDRLDEIVGIKKEYNIEDEPFYKENVRTIK